MKRDARGFSLIELMMVVLVMGILFAITLPAFTGYRSTQLVRVTSENIAGQLRLARAKAIATGGSQLVRFRTNFQGSDYHVWDGANATAKWKLPTGVTYLWAAGTVDSFRMTRDGRCNESGMIIVQDARGVRDSVSVQRSGLVLTQ